jgi:DNA-binding transcriptional LysR family regulator
MDLRDLDLNHLVVFDQLFKSNTLVKVAEKLGVTQPAISKNLATLRTFFGDPLFTRTSEGMQPTIRAKELRAPLVLALQKIREVINGGSGFDPQTSEQVFRIATTISNEYLVIPKVVEIVRKQAPGVAIITQTFMQEMPRSCLESGFYDLMISGYYDEFPGGFYRQSLYEGDWACIASSSNDAVADEMDLKAFADLKFALNTRNGELVGFVDRLLWKHKLERKILSGHSSWYALARVVESSGLVAVVPLNIWRELKGHFDLKVFSVPLEFSKFTVSQVWHEQTHKSAAHKWLRSNVFGVSQEHLKSQQQDLLAASVFR